MLIIYSWKEDFTGGDSKRAKKKKIKQKKRCKQTKTKQKQKTKTNKTIKSSTL